MKVRDCGAFVGVLGRRVKWFEGSRLGSHKTSYQILQRLHQIHNSHSLLSDPRFHRLGVALFFLILQI